MIVVRSKSIQRYLKIRRSLITTSYMSATTHSICVAEESVGISEFLSNAPPIRGILKQRYSDFIVREVNSDFEVVSLGSINGEALQSKYFSKSKAATTEDDISSFLKKISAMGLFKDALMEEGLREYLSKCLAKDDDVAVDFVCCPVALKDLRREVHTLIKQFLLSIVEADTVVVDAEQFIRFKAKCKVLKGKDGYRSEIWPSGLGNYLQFTLLKENVDTMSAVSIMSKYLRTKPNGIEFAGTKDKRAVTTQLCTIYRRKPSDFTRLNNLDFAPLIRAGDFKYVTEPLKLGDNSANRFEIVLREIASTDDVLEKTFQSIKQYGFVNYFGKLIMLVL
jgi:tRNA pseudouridine13 synthase